MLCDNQFSETERSLSYRGTTCSLLWITPIAELRHPCRGTTITKNLCCSLIFHTCCKSVAAVWSQRSCTITSLQTQTREEWFSGLQLDYHNLPCDFLRSHSNALTFPVQPPWFLMLSFVWMHFAIPWKVVTINMNAGWEFFLASSFLWDYWKRGIYICIVQWTQSSLTSYFTKMFVMSVTALWLHYT